jgi:hypothetical protein
MDNALDLRGQRLKGVTHFLDVLVSVIDAAHAADGVAETALGDVGVDPGARQQRSGRAS